MREFVDKICRYEEGQMTDEEMISFFQELVNNGMAWSLQGHYGRTAMYLIENGYVQKPEELN
tara:strand:- start:184 stop:369 length:186 start_codon:yes stop_codon:yes gene_type:complete